MEQVHKLWNKIKICSISEISKTICLNASVIYFYLEREYCKVLEFHVTNSSYFEISDAP